MITSTSTAISFAYAVFTPEYVKKFQLEEGRPSALNPDLDDDDAIESVPELKIFESSPYDLSKWDETLEAAELALAMVEFLQREGPLLAGSTPEISNKESSLQREKPSASPSSVSGAPKGRFPVKVGPKQPEKPAPVEELAAGDEDAENMSNDDLPSPMAKDQDESLEQDVDGDQENGEERLEDDRLENEEDQQEDGAFDESFTENPSDEEGSMKEDFTNEEGRLEGDGAYGG